MNAPQDTFQSYLLREVDTAGKRFEQAVENVFAVTSTKPGPELLTAAEDLTENFRIYTGLLRRMASVATRQSSESETVHA